MAKIEIMGNVGRNIKCEYRGESCYTAFSLAENHKASQTTVWHYIRAKGELAEKIGNAISTGDFLKVEGYTSHFKVEKEDGTEAVYCNVWVKFLKILKKKIVKD